MESLFAKHQRYLANTPMKYIRELMHEINWDYRLISIKGPKGVGKSTLMKQYILKNYPNGSRKVLYCTLDSIYFSSHTILELAEEFAMIGGERLFLDEIHKYPNWSKEIKEIYDLYPNLKVVISGSSLIKILNGDADLSRRCMPYDMQGLSFREFLIFDCGKVVAPRDLNTILQDPHSLCNEVNSLCHPVEKFREYLRLGYYPFYFEDKKGYYTHVEQVVNFIIEQELPSERKVDVANVRKIKALLGILANLVPFEVNISSLSGAIGLERNTVIAYLNYLEEAKLLKLLYSDLISIKKMQKPDKIYLDNTNLSFALSENANIGTLRETFALNQLGHSHEIEYGKTQGDFKIDGKTTFEIGGRDKSFKQIAGVDNSYILADDIEYPIGNKLPLWVIGFLY